MAKLMLQRQSWALLIASEGGTIEHQHGRSRPATLLPLWQEHVRTLEKVVKMRRAGLCAHVCFFKRQLQIQWKKALDRRCGRM